MVYIIIKIFRGWQVLPGCCRCTGWARPRPPPCAATPWPWPSSPTPPPAAPSRCTSPPSTGCRFRSPSSSSTPRSPTDPAPAPSNSRISACTAAALTNFCSITSSAVILSDDASRTTLSVAIFTIRDFKALWAAALVAGEVLGCGLWRKDDFVRWIFSLACCQLFVCHSQQYEAGRRLQKCLVFRRRVPRWSIFFVWGWKCFLLVLRIFYVFNIDLACGPIWASHILSFSPLTLECSKSIRSLGIYGFGGDSQITTSIFLSIATVISFGCISVHVLLSHESWYLVFFQLPSFLSRFLLFTTAAIPSFLTFIPLFSIVLSVCYFLFISVCVLLFSSARLPFFALWLFFVPPWLLSLLPSVFSYFIPPLALTATRLSLLISFSFLKSTFFALLTASLTLSLSSWLLHFLIIFLFASEVHLWLPLPLSLRFLRPVAWVLRRWLVFNFICVWDWSGSCFPWF